MRVVVINRVATTQYVDGLPERGATPAGATRYFPISPFMLYGRDGTGHNVAENLRRQEDAGNIYFEIELDKNDIGLTGRKLLRVSFAAESFTDTDASQAFDAADAFPSGARFLGGRAEVLALVANSHADFAAGTSLLDFGLDDSSELFIKDLDVETGSGTTGEKRLAVSTSLTGNAQTLVTTTLMGMDLGGKKMRFTLTNSAANAIMTLNTAGSFVGEVLYSVH